MDENEVIIRLGLQDIKQLMSLLDFSDRGREINSLRKKYLDSYFSGVVADDELLKEKHNHIEFVEEAKHGGGYFRIHGALNSQENVSSRMGYKKGWYCILKGGENNLEELGNPPEARYFPKINPKKLNVGCNFFDTGHILAKRFYKYISRYRNYTYLKKSEKNRLLNSRLINDPFHNLFVQFSVANGQKNKKCNRRSQGFYEEEIDKFLLSNKSTVLFYEVKVIYFDKGDRIPIGTEIFFKTLDGPKVENILKENHVFIPNFDWDFDIQVASACSEQRVQRYRDFYSLGVNESHIDCFKNSDLRSEQLKSYFLVISGLLPGIYSSLSLAKKAIGIGDKDVPSGVFKGDIEKSERNQYAIYQFSPSDMDEVKVFLQREKIIIPTGNNNNLFYPVTKEYEIPGIYFDFDSVKNNKPEGDPYPAAEPGIEIALLRLP
ncbi:TPA: hypothetical protein U2E43_000350 [Streptococcus suis]|nr:hypothetical protein [Streptococcus suis]